MHTVVCFFSDLPLSRPSLCLCCILVHEMLRPMQLELGFRLIKPGKRRRNRMYKKNHRDVLWARLDAEIDDSKYPPGTVIEWVCRQDFFP